MKLGNLQSKIGTIRKIVSNNLINKGVFSKQTSKQFFILMYHGIDKKQDTTYNQRFFSQSNFEKQIVLFKKHFNLLSYTDFINKNFDRNRPNVLLTFDDGYANNYRYALPILDKHSVHAYFFITGVDTLNNKVLWADALDIVSKHTPENRKITVDNIVFEFLKGEFVDRDKNLLLKKYIKANPAAGYTAKQELVDQLLGIYDFTKVPELIDYWQLMTDEEIYKTSLSPNITIGSHGFYHNNLGSLSNGDAVAEVLQSKAYLKGITGKEIKSIGFPDGSYTELLNDSLNNEGINEQFVVDYAYNDGGRCSFSYDRIGLYPFMGNNNELLYKILHS